MESFLEYKVFYRLRNIFNCVLPHKRHLTAGLLYNDFGQGLKLHNRYCHNRQICLNSFFKHYKDSRQPAMVKIEKLPQLKLKSTVTYMNYNKIKGGRGARNTIRETSNKRNRVSKVLVDHGSKFSG